VLAANVLTALAKGVEDDASRLYDHRDGGSDVVMVETATTTKMPDARREARGGGGRAGERASGRAGERASGEVW
jgi:hypothetical protein